ncbi:MAG TPA: helix-turn-helix transcriptional regulator [Trebonia sp.]|nr:helix-turn-helix transcriptional regulator [Trebonia sp.]
MTQMVAASPLKVFGEMLTFFRERAGLTYEQLGGRVYLSESMLRKIEAGTRAPSANLVKTCEAIPEMQCHGALLKLYETMGPHLKVGVYPGWFQRWPEKEASAKRLRWFEPQYIPGLAQTERYARAVLSTKVGATEDVIEDDVAGRIERQRVLDREKPPQFWTILDEGVLRRHVGSTEITREAMLRLADLARRPHVIIQVIPLGAGAHEGLRGAGFVLAEFDNAATVAYQDTAVFGQIVEDQDAVQELVYLWDALQLVVLPRAESLRLIERIAEELA